LLHSIDCTARINAQDPTYPTYKAIACTAHMNANNTGFPGALIDCTATITGIIVANSRSYNQGIRLVVTIDDVNVSASLVGSLNIQHDKNQISDITLYLGDTEYSPRTNSHIDIDKVIVITAYINGYEKKLFTGTLDKPSAVNTPDFLVTITARDDGKKLLKKTTTVVSVQDLADTTKRNDCIKYLASVASVTDVDIPEMNAVTIDNSFSHQTVWDMIQKEAMIELYWIKFDEEGNMKLLLDEIKSDTELYPSPDWTYTEDRITRLGYEKDEVKINKIIVLGKTSRTRIPTTETVMTNPGVDYTTPVILFSDFLSFSEEELIEYNSNLNYTKTVGDFILKIQSYGSGGGGGNIHIYVGCKSQQTWWSYVITSKSGVVGGNATLIKTIDASSAGGTIDLKGMYWVIDRDGVGTNYEQGSKGYAFTFEITVNGYNKNQDSIPATYETDTTYETRYDQISASVTDPNSIIKYGEKDGGSIEYPLLETVEQCTAVGKKIIRDSHRLLGQTNFNIPFNPLVKTGQTILITDTKIGINERYYIESVNHNIGFGDGKVNAETVLGGVLYV